MGTPELPNACQGLPKQDENVINSMVLATRPFSQEVVVLDSPLAKLGSLLTRTGAQWGPWQGLRISKMGAKASHAAKP